MKSRQYANERDSIVAILGLSMGLLFWLIVLTYPGFFFYDPFRVHDLLRSSELLSILVGWILIANVVPLLLVLYAIGFRRAITLVPLFTVIWPIALHVTEMTIWIKDKVPYFQYFYNYPIFIFTDIAIPCLFLYAWVKIQRGSIKEIFSHGFRGFFLGKKRLERS